MKSGVETISIIGSGNVATHLALALANAGFNLLEIHSSRIENAAILAGQVNANPIAKIEDMSPTADLYLISTSDRAYAEIASNFPHKNKLLVHTAGSLSMHVLKKASHNYGVLYPFQTLSIEKNVSIQEVPFLYCGSNSITENAIKSVAQRISKNVQHATDEQRKYLHIAAVFACNFVNRMYAIASELTKQHNLDFTLLHPLIQETATKAMTGDPAAMQTGPAARRDHNVIDDHLAVLEKAPKIRDIYRQISQSILDSTT